MDGEDDIIDKILEEGEGFDGLEVGDYGENKMTVDEIMNEEKGGQSNSVVPGLEDILGEDPAFTADTPFPDTENYLLEKKKKEEEEEKKRLIEEEKRKAKEALLKELQQKEIEKKKQEMKMLEERKKEKQRKKEEEQRIEESFIPSYSNPTHFVNYIEVERTNSKLVKVMESFILQNHRRNEIKNDLLEIQAHSEISSNALMKNPISVMYTKLDTIIICDPVGVISFFSMQDNKLLKEIQPPKNMGGVQINCLDLTEDMGHLFVGYKDGTVAINFIINSEWKYVSNKILKDCECLEIKCFKREYNVFHFVTSGSDNTIKYNIVKDGTFLWRIISSNLIIPNNNIPICLVKFFHFAREFQRYFSNLNELSRFVILGSTEFVKIYSLEPEIQEIHNFPKPKYLQDIHVPDAQVGIGKIPPTMQRFIKKDEANHLLLAISWGTIVYLYRLPLSQGEINKYTQLGYYINNNEIIRLGFLSHSVVYVIDNSFCIKIISTRKINQGIPDTNTEPLKPKNNSNAELQTGRLIDLKILGQKKYGFKDKDGKPIETYGYSIVDNTFNSNIQVLAEKQLHNVKLIDWEKFLNNLQTTDNYKNLLAVGIDLYQGKMTGFTNIPFAEKDRKKKIGEFLRQIISQYVIFNTGSKKSGTIFLEDDKENEQISECINMTIEFCIEIDAVEYLLKNIEPLFETKDYGELFLSKLEPYILCDKIIDVVLTEDIVCGLIDLYLKNDKLDVLSQVLLHINIKSLDTRNIRTKLEEMNLVSPLIYLYMNGSDEDYFAPLYKMFDYFYTKALSLKDYDNYTSSLKRHSLKEITRSKEYYGHKILWYINWCLTGRKFPNTEKKMKEDLFNKFVPNVTYWLLSQKVSKEFLAFEPKVYFSVFKNIFSIKSLVTKLIDAEKNPDIKITALTTLLSEDFHVSDVLPPTLIDYLANTCKKFDDDLIKFYLYDFVINISKQNFIRKNLRQDAICFIIRYYVRFTPDINHQETQLLVKVILKLLDDYRETAPDKKEQQQKKTEAEENKATPSGGETPGDNPSEDTPKVETTQNNKNVITETKREKMFNNEDYKKILYYIESPLFDEIKFFLLNKLDMFKESLDLLLNSEEFNTPKNTKVFSWIEERLHDKKKTPEQINQMKLEILKQVTKLAEVSVKDFEELSRDIFPDDQRGVIDKLKDNPEIQLAYVEKTVERIKISVKENENNILDKDQEEIDFVLGLHIKLLCDLKKFGRILTALKSCNLYPLDECLLLCSKCKAYDASIYLFLATGSSEEALKLCLEKLEEKYNNFIQIIREQNIDEQTSNQLWNEIKKVIGDSRGVCENNEQQTEELWFDLLDNLYSYENQTTREIEDNKEKSEMIQTLTFLKNNFVQEIKDLMERMCSFVSISNIIEEVTKRYENAGFVEFKELIIKILSNYNSQVNILDAARHLLSNLIIENENIFCKLSVQGELLNVGKCHKCGKEFNKAVNSKEKVLVFNCKHLFHKSCAFMEKGDSGINAVCPVCREVEIQETTYNRNSLIKRNFSVIESKKEVANSEFQVNVTFSSQRILQKFGKYDKQYFQKKKLMIDSGIVALKEDYRKVFK